MKYYAMDTLTSQPYQQRLVEQLQTRQTLSPRVGAAFLQVPRHPFITHFYERPVGSHEWIRHEQSETATWYEHIYQDAPLITQVDEQRRILSSSSQPGIMATMLDALALEPGMHVLEIGTGTGYNAGLLAVLAEDPYYVTTIDIDAQIVERARTTLTSVIGNGITVAFGDGSKGFSEHAPYDRIIATASASRVPCSWVEQLALDGVLVCILQPRYASLGGVLVAKKISYDLVKGAIVTPASFMVLREENAAPRTIPIDFHASPIVTFAYDPTLFELSLLQRDHHFSFFFHQAIPDLRMLYRPQQKEYIYYRENFPQGYLVFLPQASPHVELRGDHACAYQLWNCFTCVVSSWFRYEQPLITQYEFEMNPTSGYQTLSLPTSHGLLWPFEV
jgi:protein-L-isoaspartate(D-aspartate) O-methyltransferase